jgi:hypothetical protein
LDQAVEREEYGGGDEGAAELVKKVAVERGGDNGVEEESGEAGSENATEWIEGPDTGRPEVGEEKIERGGEAEFEESGQMEGGEESEIEDGDGKLKVGAGGVAEGDDGMISEEEAERKAEEKELAESEAGEEFFEVIKVAGEEAEAGRGSGESFGAAGLLNVAEFLAQGEFVGAGDSEEEGAEPFDLDAAEEWGGFRGGRSGKTFKGGIVGLAVLVDERGAAEEGFAGVKVVDVEGLVEEGDFATVGEVVKVEGEVFAEVKVGVKAESVLADEVGAEDFVAGVVEAAVKAEEADNPGTEGVGISRWFRDGSNAELGDGVGDEILETDTAGNEVSFVFLDGLNHAGEKVGGEVVVVVNKHDVVAADLFEAGIASGAGATVGLSENAQARVGESVDNVGRAVGGAVVNENQFKIRERLGEDTFN